MKYSKTPNCALHNGVLLLKIPRGNTISVQILAEIQNLSPTYLSKILTKLAKHRNIESIPRVNGGYKVSKQKMKFLFLM